MSPEFAQKMQQLFARQMAVAFLHHCAHLEAPISLVHARLEALEATSGPATSDASADADARARNARALEAEFLLAPFDPGA